MKLPEMWAVCESCDSERAGHPPEYVAWSAKAEQWLCSECRGDDHRTKGERPLAYAEDALDDSKTMQRRPAAAATARRLGV